MDETVQPAALGTLAEFVSPSEALADADGVVQDGHERRLQRWEMQSAARDLLPGHRVCTCYRHKLPGKVDEDKSVRVYRRESKHTYYKGLKVCGSVWVCPVCAAKVSERRRLELQGAVDGWQDQGGTVLLLTLTVPHQRETEPFSLLDGLLDGFRKYGQGKRAWTRLVEGYAGSVRALEVTHGANGWHPHLHVLVFIEGTVSNRKRLQMQRVLLDRWAATVSRVGLGEVNHHGLKLDDGTQAAQYVGKWGMVEELTKAHIKQGRQGGRTPWALLADYLAGDDQAGALFREFVAVFKGRSQLQWSRGLRDRLGLNAEQSDEELANETVKAEDALLGRIHPADWKLIRQNELRGVVLELLRSGTWDDLDLLLDRFRGAGERLRREPRRKLHSNNVTVCNAPRNFLVT